MFYALFGLFLLLNFIFFLGEGRKGRGKIQRDGEMGGIEVLNVKLTKNLYKVKVKKILFDSFSSWENWSAAW